VGQSPLQASGMPLFFPVSPAPEGLRPPTPEYPRATAVRVVARSLSLMQKEALVTSSATEAVWRLASDEGPYLLGDDVAPPPLAFMSVGMCTSFGEAVCRHTGIPRERVRLVLHTRYTMKGSAAQGTLRGGALPSELFPEVDLPTGQVAEAVHSSPVYGLVRPCLASRFSLTHNGRTVEVRGVLAADAAPPPDPRSTFQGLRPAADARAVERDGPSPRTEEDTSSTGSSLAETQDRTVHLEAVCGGTPEGLWRVEHRMYNPRGNIFHLACDPQGRRAPDPLSYVSAGIAFCFMTQLARYSRILRKSLRGLGVVQETVFREGGSADPVVTHVYVDTEEDDSFAQDLVAAGERTCFLHALCRTELDVQLRR
jgi:hypothetical protein